LLEPKEQEHRYVQIDSWINFATHAHKPIHAGPLLSFDSQHLPDWLYIWEHDYDTLRDLIYEHVQRIASRYSKQVQVWNVVSGIHANNSFNLSFEQLMELTRMCCLLVKKLSPH
ncbi:MAG: endo-1,4-beta-xylanase, partial [Phycisphaerae bacterium]|nr:endo-1,4-beta-xylanase [Phycisphaerae bacterium]